MLNKLIFSLWIISVTSKGGLNHSQTHDKNIKTMGENVKKFNDTKKQIDDNNKKLNEKFNNFKKIHSTFYNKRSKTVEEYNRLVKEYGSLVKSYNDNKKSYCAKLPEVSALMNKNNNLTKEENECNKWYYKGRRFGDVLGKANAVLGKIDYYGTWLRNRLACHLNTIGGVSKNKLLQENRECFKTGFHKQMHISVVAYYKNKPEDTMINDPYMGDNDKIKMLKDVLISLKH